MDLYSYTSVLCLIFDLKTQSENEEYYAQVTELYKNGFTKQHLRLFATICYLEANGPLFLYFCMLFRGKRTYTT